MDLTLSRRGDYVIRAALALAAAWDGEGVYRKIRQISDEMRLPLSYTPHVLGLLAEAGLAEAKAGRAGGYRLTRDPVTISMLEVIEAAEGDLVSRRCPVRGGPCRWDDVCAVHQTWGRASEAIRSVLESTSIAEVAATDRRLDLRAGRTPARGRRRTMHAPQR